MTQILRAKTFEPVALLDRGVEGVHGTGLTGAGVTGTWSDGKTETIASPDPFQSNRIHRRINSVTFTVTDVELAGYIWEDEPESITISAP